MGGFPSKSNSPKASPLKRPSPPAASPDASLAERRTVPPRCELLKAQRPELKLLSDFGAEIPEPAEAKGGFLFSDGPRVEGAGHWENTAR